MTMTQIIPTQQHDAANITKHLFFRTTEFLFVFFGAVGVPTVTAFDSLCANDGLVVISTVRGCCATAFFLFFLIRLVLFVFFDAVGPVLFLRLLIFVAVSFMVGSAVIGASTTETCDSSFDGLVFIS